MTKAPAFANNPPVRMSIAAILGWLLPGAGHLFIGDRGRGTILLVAIAVTFWTGVAIGGVKTTVDPHGRSLWFLGQIFAGGHTLAALGLSYQVQPAEGEAPESLVAYGRSEEIAVVYTAICGMLNIMMILDVVVRAEKQLKQPSGSAAVATGGSG